MENIEVRKAQKQDLTAILKLYTQFEADKEKILSIEQAEKMLEKLSRYPNYFLYVAALDTQIVGTFSLLIMDNLVHEGTPSGIVDSVAVDPQFHGQSIGKKMMQHAMHLCEESGCYKLALSSNFKWGVHEFYEKLGFKQHGVSFYVETQKNI